MLRSRWFFLLFLGGYIFYGLVMAYYLFIGSNESLPLEMQGTSADPHLFMTAEEQMRSLEFSRIHNLLYFLAIPLDWIIYLFVLIFGISLYFQRISEQVSRFFFVQTSLYVILFSLISAIISFPLSWLSRQVSLQYGISTQSFASWMRDYTIEFWIGTLLMTVMVWVLYTFIRRSEKRWWLHVWLISIPFTILLMFVKPVLIDPLYNDFYSLQDEVLEEKILQLATEANIPADRVYEVNMSEKTNALNAYVTGIGSNLRIVLWDTTLKKLEHEETLFIMAHEIGHYVMNHLYLNVIGSIMLTFFGLYFGKHLFHWILTRYSRQLHVLYKESLASLPVLLLIFSLLSFIISPAMNAISRHHERAADLFAVEMTEDPDAAIRAFHKLAVMSLSDVNPPLIVKWFRYGHPTMVERLHYLNEHKTHSLKEDTKSE